MKKRNVDRKVVEAILGDLETKIAAYVDDWWQELGIRKGSGASIDRRELQLAGGLIERERPQERKQA